MKTIIAGSRTVKSYMEVVKAIELSGFEITEVVSGLATGPDKFGERWATSHQIPVRRFPAKWGKYGKGAGFIRNKEMADYADALIAVWDGNSRGTKHMIDTAEELGLKIYVHVVDQL